MSRCPIDNLQLKGAETICQECSRQTRIRLAQIPVMYVEAGAYLEPGRGGSGSSGSERTIGVNLSALGFREASEILGVLNEWVALVIEGRDLAPYKATGTVQDRVEDVCSFLLRHSAWIAGHEAALDWFAEVQAIHKQGISATRKFEEKQTKIKCPTMIDDFDQYGNATQRMCGKWLELGKEVLDIVECKRCKREWTSLGLVAVAIDNPGVPVWFDAQSIGAFLQVSADYVRKLAKKHGAKKLSVQGEQVFDLAEMKAIHDRVKKVVA